MICDDPRWEGVQQGLQDLNERIRTLEALHRKGGSGGDWAFVTLVIFSLSLFFGTIMVVSWFIWG